MDNHTYTTDLDWSGSTAAGHRSYGRAHTVGIRDTAPLGLSADAAFGGDADLANPEELLLAAASSCQLLSFLAVAARAHVDVVRYADSARAIMPADAVPRRITEIVLTITVVVRGADEQTVNELLEQAHQRCFIANSLSARVHVVADVEVDDAAAGRAARA